MPPPANREQFFDLVRRSGVLDVERLDSFAQLTSDSGTSLDQPQAVAARMIRDGLLTTFQAKQLLQGKWRRFLISGKYKLLELIGAGGMGAVYLCEHIYMRRLVALKVLPVDKLDDPSAVERFYREARAGGALDDVNIVRVYDIDQDEKLHFLVMEYVDGSSLHEIVARHGPMDFTRAAQYIAQTARGLQHAHEAGLVHRDVKPGNLLLDRSGTIKILDLGLARFFNVHKDNVTEKYDDNAILGTADYLAPEQAVGSAVDIRADIYSLGATFYFLLTGHAPFEDGTVTQKLLWHQTRSPRAIRELRPEVPEAMVIIIDKMMAKSPTERFATPNEVFAALRPWMDRILPPPPSAEMPRRSPASSAPGTQSRPLVRGSPASKVDTTPALNGSSNASASTRTSRPTGKPTPVFVTPAEIPAVDGAVVNQVPLFANPPSRKLTQHKQTAIRPRRGLRTLAVAIASGASVIVASVAIAWFVMSRVGDAPSNKRAAPRIGSRLALPTKEQTPIQPEEIIPAAQAGQHLKQRCTIELFVRHAGKDAKTERYFLNSKDDYTAPDNFTVTFTKRVAEQLQGKGVGDIGAYFQRKTVLANGVVTEFRGRPQIEVDDISQLQVLERKP